MTSKQKVWLHNTHQKSIRQTSFL